MQWCLALEGMQKVGGQLPLNVEGVIQVCKCILRLVNKWNLEPNMLEHMDVAVPRIHLESNTVYMNDYIAIC